MGEKVTPSARKRKIRKNRKQTAKKKKTPSKPPSNKAQGKGGKKSLAGKKKSEGSKGKKGGAGGKLVTIVKKIGKKGGTVTKVIRTPGDKKWKHDKFEATQKPTSLKLFISNLDFGATNRDLKELFGECGPLKRCNIHFNAAGKSQGTADVVFKNRADALKAMKLYNGRTLDGRVLEMSKIEERPAPGVASKRGRGRGVMSRLGKS